MKKNLSPRRAIEWLMWDADRAKKIGYAAVAALAVALFFGFGGFGSANDNGTTTSNSTATAAPDVDMTDCKAVAVAFASAYTSTYPTNRDWVNAATPYTTSDMQLTMRLSDKDAHPAGIANGKPVKVTQQPGACDVTIPTTPSGVLSVQVDTHGGTEYKVTGVTQ